MKKRVGRNERCPCGSGRKFKACCLRKTKTAVAERRAGERSFDGLVVLGAIGVQHMRFRGKGRR